MLINVEIVIQIEKILSEESFGEVALQPIVDEVLCSDNALNILQMLSLSCEYDNQEAQCTYLSIISECVRVFERHVFQVARHRDQYTSDCLYYYLEFLLGCSESNLKREYIEGVDLTENDLAYPLFIKLTNILRGHDT